MTNATEEPLGVPASVAYFASEGRPGAIVLDPVVRPGVYRVANILVAAELGARGSPIISGLTVPPWWEPYVPEIESFVAGLRDNVLAPEDEQEGGVVTPVSDIWDSELFTFVLERNSPTNKIALRSRAGVLSRDFLRDMSERWTRYSETRSPAEVLAS